MTMTREQYDAERGRLEDAIGDLDDAFVRQFRREDGTYETVTERHTAEVRTRWGDTTRECFCAAAGGRSHDESIFPLVGSDGRTY